MLRLTSPGEIAPAAPRAAGRPSHAERVSFGGVVFELLSAEPLAIDPDDARFFSAGADARTVADVACAVRVDGGRDWSRGRMTFGFSSEANGITRVRARTVEAELSTLGPGRYAAAAEIAPGSDAIVGLSRALAGAIVYREGGLFLHGVGIELDGAAVVFVGPSGAGKSTAARLTEGARCFAHDHVALVPVGGVWHAWGLPGGRPSGASIAEGAVFPLAAVLRVRQAAPDAQPKATLLHGAKALFALRESVELADHSLTAEDVYLHAVSEVCGQVPVGSIATVLNRDHAPVLRALLGTSHKRARS